MEDAVNNMVHKENILFYPFFDTYVCLDIETTSRPMNRIIEIGAVLVVKGRLEKTLISVGNHCGVDFDNQVFDTLEFALGFMPGTCGLSNLTDILDVPWEGRHRAHNDARATMEVFEKLKILFYMAEGEGIRLNEHEIAKVARNPEYYAGVQEKFRFSF